MQDKQRLSQKRIKDERYRNKSRELIVLDLSSLGQGLDGQSG